MKIKHVLAVAAFASGLFCGPSALEIAALSQPPLRWPDLAFVFLGCVVALLVVLGIQGARGNMHALRWAWAFFALVAVFCLGAGVSAILGTLIQTAVAPHSFLFFVLGVGMLVGCFIVRRVFAKAFATEGLHGPKGDG